jgi:elongation factor P--(R)-beta-lysine ligase
MHRNDAIGLARMTESGGWWRRERFAARRPNLVLRAEILAAIRRFFAARGFIEVETPALQASPGLEPHLHAFETRFIEGGAAPRALYLHTSPEFAMKKLLAGGMERIFQLAHCFRNGERGALHSPEFTMLEWYRAGATYRDLMADCEALLAFVLDAVGRPRFSWRGNEADPRAPWQYLSVADAFQKFCGIDVLASCGDRARLAEAARPAGVAPHAGDTWEDLYFRIFLEKIEPHLGLGAPAILYDYPIAMAALARPKHGDPRLAERFELYVAGLELANAFSELTDAGEQRRRFRADQELRRARYGEAYPIDEDFLAALAAMPESAGIALGVDRLVMLAVGADTIDDVLWAPV